MKKTKILMVAVFNPTSTNYSQAIGFENNNCDVIRYDYRIQSKLIGSLNRDSEIIYLCETEKPDIVFFSKCDDVDINVVKECNKTSKTVLWYMDHAKPFTKSLIKKIKKCRYSFFSGTGPYKEAKEINQNSVYFLQEGFDEYSNFPMNVPIINDVSMIGHFTELRKRYYEIFKFKVYDNVYNKDHSKAVSETKINLNFTDGVKIVGDGTSDRVYKVLASKGFLLTLPWLDMKNDFIVGQDLDIFSSPDELKDKIDFYLKNENERNKIAEHGYQTVQKFSRTNFAKRILEICIT